MTETQENIQQIIQEDVQEIIQENLQKTMQESAKQNLQEGEKRIRWLALAAMGMLVWVLIWALVFKLGSEVLLVRNYTNLKDMTIEERILWDIIPFQYRGDEYWKMRQFLDTILNCFILAPLGVLLCYAFKKDNLWRNVALCFAFSLCIEILQLFTTVGNPATEDLITNTVGCFIGYGIYRWGFRRLNEKNTYRFLVLSNVVLVLIVLFSLVTMALASDTIFKLLTKTL